MFSGSKIMYLMNLKYVNYLIAESYVQNCFILTKKPLDQNLSLI